MGRSPVGAASFSGERRERYRAARQSSTTDMRALGGLDALGCRLLDGLALAKGSEKMTGRSAKAQQSRPRGSDTATYR